MKRTLLLLILIVFVASVDVRATTVNVNPTNNIETIVNANAAGTTFVITAGTYRMQSVTPKSGDIFEGQPGAILNGSQLLTSFTRSGSYWVASGQTQHGTADGVCLSGYSGCEYPEDLFFNNVPLQRVESLADVTAGKWYFDYSAAKVYFLDDPTGKTVEIGVTTHAFSGSATNVTIKGLTIEKYAAPAQDGPISGSGWTIDSNEIRLNHGGAIRLNSYQVIVSNYIHHNGQEGLTGSGSNILVQDNEIAFNNTLSFDFGWEAGGAKFSNTTNLVVQGNYVHDNKGPGLSLDYQNYNWLIQGNHTSRNYVAGILDETSYDGTARYNIIEHDASYPGKTNPGMWWACGFFNLDSSNAQVYGNTLIDNSDGICAVSFPRGSGNRGPFEVQNLSAHDNVIVQSISSTEQSAAGAVSASDTTSLNVFSSSWNNHWTSNTYKLSNALAYSWQTGTNDVNVVSSRWQSFGQDITGTWVSPTDSTFPSTKFSANQTVSTVGSTQVWSLPTTSSTLIATEGSGVHGTVTKIAGPIRTSGAWWWNVKYADGNEGWSQETSITTSTVISTKTPVVYQTANLSAVSSGPTFGKFNWAGFPDTVGTVLSATAAGDNVTLTINVAAAGIYDVQVSGKGFNTRGIWQLAINGVKVGAPEDEFQNNGTTGIYQLFDLGTVNFPTAGNYALKFTVTGKDATSMGYLITFDDITLTPQ